jgi:hypothetical protein
VFTETLSEFFDENEFAEVATYDGATQKRVIFDREYLEQFGVVAGAQPVALAPATEFTTAAIGKTLVVQGTTYTIRTREPVGDGALVRMKLETP